MTLAFEELFGVREAFTGIPMAGRTDSRILADALAAHSVTSTSIDLEQFRDAYARRLGQEIDRPGPRKGVMPGVRILLDVLSARDDVHLALLTGNYETTAQTKLEYFDLWRYFRGGAFGDGAHDRNGLLPKAVASVASCGGPCVAPSDAIIVGDTPLDVACAQASGARAVAVATGSHSVHNLRDAGADVVLQDLSDIAAVLRAFSLT
jgi:phosphoglycolate phosphatase-like HAD superfamily hydrolase